MPALSCCTCRSRPAGYTQSPFSAYCATCQPHHEPVLPGSRVCRCPACGEDFSGTSAFDTHRPGRPCGRPEEHGLEPVIRGETIMWGWPRRDWNPNETRQAYWQDHGNQN